MRCVHLCAAGVYSTPRAFFFLNFLRCGFWDGLPKVWGGGENGFLIFFLFLVFPRRFITSRSFSFFPSPANVLISPRNRFSRSKPPYAPDYLSAAAYPKLTSVVDAFGAIPAVKTYYTKMAAGDDKYKAGPCLTATGSSSHTKLFARDTIQGVYQSVLYIYIFFLTGRGER